MGSRGPVFRQADAQASGALVDPIRALIDQKPHQAKCEVGGRCGLERRVTGGRLLADERALQVALALRLFAGRNLGLAVDTAADRDLEPALVVLEGYAHLAGDEPLTLDASNRILERLRHGDGDLIDRIDIQAGDRTDGAGGPLGDDRIRPIGREADVCDLRHLSGDIPRRAARETLAAQRYEPSVTAEPAACPCSIASATSASHSRSSCSRRLERTRQKATAPPAAPSSTRPFLPRGNFIARYL